MTKRVYILRGPSGCGKTSWRESYVANNKVGQVSRVISMDDARYQLIDGQTTYVYDPKQNGELAAQCWSRFARAMMDPIVGTIVVDNTHTTKWQWEPFVMTAKIGGARVSVVDFVTDSVAVAKILASRYLRSLLDTVYFLKRGQ